jgi:hypothetical protein
MSPFICIQSLHRWERALFSHFSCFDVKKNGIFKSKEDVIPLPVATPLVVKNQDWFHLCHESLSLFKEMVNFLKNRDHDF